MEKDIKELLYNKELKDITPEDYKILKTLRMKKESEDMTRFTLISCPLIIFLGSLIAKFAIGIPWEIIYFLWGFLTPTLTPLFCFASLRGRVSLKELGITRKDWKELKKSGRIKELIQLSYAYKNSDYSVINDLEASNEEISVEIERIEKYKQGLIARMTENNAQIDETKKKIDTDDGETIDPVTDINSL